MDVMDPSIAQHHQETLESMLVCAKPQDDQKKPRPPPEHALKCPRCDSTNTKFCYYNNYSLTQPRYFCKSCRRYWTKGGTLRNVPVGGGCRKNKRSSSSAKLMRTGSGQDQTLSSSQSSPVSGLGYDSSDLSLAFARLQKQNEMGFDGQDLSVMSVGSENNALQGLFGNFAEGGFQGQSLYYDYGNLAGVHHEQMGMIGYEQDHGCAVKQEYCGGREGDQQRVLWGFPWQIGGDENMGGDFENNAGGGRAGMELVPRGMDCLTAL